MGCGPAGGRVRPVDPDGIVVDKRFDLLSFFRQQGIETDGAVSGAVADQAAGQFFQIDAVFGVHDVNAGEGFVLIYACRLRVQLQGHSALADVYYSAFSFWICIRKRENFRQWFEPWMMPPFRLPFRQNASDRSGILLHGNRLAQQTLDADPSRLRFFQMFEITCAKNNWRAGPNPGYLFRQLRTGQAGHGKVRNNNIICIRLFFECFQSRCAAGSQCHLITERLKDLAADTGHDFLVIHE